MRTYTVSEAADLTGLSRKAIARRIERGSLRCVLRDGRRRIPLAELVRAGLVEDDERADEEFDPRFLLPGGSRPQADLPVPYDASQTLTAVVRELFDRFERQAAELASFRALTVQAESLRVTSEIADLRARLAELETQPRPKELVHRDPAEAVPRSAAEPTRRGARPRQELWLPAGAQAPAQPRPAQPQDQAQLEGEIGRLRSHLAELEARRPPRRLGRATRLAVEAAFIAAVAVGVWFADLGTAAIFAFMAATWIVVAVIESVSWRRD
jgi:excisionase family DNA binding protein